jgi:hypothetical protein
MRRSEENRMLSELIEERKKQNIRKYITEFEPEYKKYELKTRPPFYTWNWRLNLLRRTREEELRDEAMKAARLKCHRTANTFTKCTLDHPREEATTCKPLFEPMQICFHEEFLVEMDKRRRDIGRNTEWWWQNIYSEEGEIGAQSGEPPSTYVEKVGDITEWVIDKLYGWLYKNNK